MSRRALSGLLALALGGCQAFPEIASGECGNRVVEAGEDCDFFARSGSECRPPDSIGACHFDCSAAADGTPRECPSGFGCDENNVCRRALNAFEAVSNPVPGGYRALESADFDGDGRADVVALDARGGKNGLTRFDVQYYDRQGQPVAAVSFADSVAEPALFTQGSDGARAGIVMARDWLGVLLGERDRTLSPDVRPTYFLPLGRMAVVLVAQVNIGHTSPLVVLADRDGQLELSAPTMEGVLLTKMATLPYTLEEAAPFVKGALLVGDEHPCDDLALAELGGGEVSVFQMCQRRASGKLIYRDQALVLTRELPDGATVAAGPQIADIDGDGHADLLVSSDQGLFVAFGDGTSLSPFTAFEPVLYDIIEEDYVEQSRPIMPLAAGDFTGDGRADFVDPHGLYVTLSIPGKGDNLVGFVHENEAAPWTEARIADVTADGRPDVVASSTGQTTLSIFTGTGTARPNSLSVSTAHPAEQLAIGDFDGDQAKDIAFVERGAGPSGEDEFFVAFGGSFETLSEPLPGGHIGRSFGLTILPDGPDNLRDGLAIIHALTDEEGTTGSAMSLVQATTRRNFVSPVQLEYVGDANATQDAAAVRVATGRFREKSSIDALALAYRGTDADPHGFDFPVLWILPNLSSRASTILPIGWNFDARLVPVVIDVDDPEYTTMLARLAAGDITGDGLDEVVIAASIEDHTRCLVTFAKLAGPELRIEPLPSLELDEPCAPAPSLRITDLDGDGAADLLLAMGARDSEGRLLAFWNDGQGGFDPNDVTTVAPAEAGPRAFTLYPSDAGGPVRVAYVSDHAAHVLESRGSERTFVEVAEVPNLTAATGIAAGDLNGDGLVDLAVADDGWLQLYRAGVVR